MRRGMGAGINETGARIADSGAGGGRQEDVEECKEGNEREHHGIGGQERELLELLGC